jgi:TonB family protein
VTCWRLFLIAGLACASAEAAAEVPAVYSCEDPSVSTIVIRPGYGADLERFRKASDPSERRKLAEVLRDGARTPTERDLAKFVNAGILASDRNYAEAQHAYEEVAASRVVSRNNVDAARIALANMAVERNDYDGAVAWVQPMVAAGCKTVADGVRRILAYVYQEKGQLAEALEQVDKVKHRGDADADHWRAVRIDFRCVLEGAVPCMGQIASLASNGELGTAKALAAANRHIAKMSASESGLAALARGKEYGVLDERGQLVNSKVQEAVPINRPPPVYPREALRRGISGYVDMALVINPDGTVKSAEVWDSRPRNIFDEAALSAVRRAIFKPKLVNGKAVEGRGLQRYQFLMEN